MKKELYQEIEIPEGVEVKLNGNVLSVKGVNGENKKMLNLVGLEFEIKDEKIKIGSRKASKKEKKMMNSIAAHITNMIKGVQEKFEYKLKICSSHFPISVSVKGRDVEVKNFLGEKIPRKVKIPEGVEIEVDGDIIMIKSSDKELAGQAAANFEMITRIRARDKRVFQDGIYITDKAGRKM